MTVKEIAQQLNLSISTVSRVLNGQARKYRISRNTEEKVKALAAKKGFSPNLLARNLRMQKTDTIGLIIPDISNPFFANLAKTLELGLRKADKTILLCDTHEDSALERQSLALLLGRKVDGLLIAPVGLKSDHLHGLSVPTVLIDRYFEGLGMPYVSTHNFEGAYRATRYLIERGHQNIGCIQGLADTTSNRERVRGFLQAADEHHLPPERRQVVGSDFSNQSGYAATMQLLQAAKRPTAIFALGNQIALGAMQALHTWRLGIPHDVSLISFDEQPYFQFTSPPLTTIRQPVEQIAQQAVHMLLKLMEGLPVNSRLLHPKMIERQSVRSL